jgi:hypothetical protein
MSFLETIVTNFEELEDFLKLRWVSGVEFQLPIRCGTLIDAPGGILQSFEK